MDGPRMRFSSWAGKRAKFSSWGGKRGEQGLIDSNEDDIFDEKRAKFSSWAGKRSGEEDEFNWAANRADDLNDFGMSEDKRAKFSSWAGKRDEDKRKFSSWAGKRYDENSGDFNDIIEDKRARFNSWAGKRAKFNSWGGKRNNNEDGNEYDENIIEDKRNLPWNNYDQYGNDKRAKFSSWGGKRGEDWWTGKRARFNSWGGKRTVNITNDTIDHEDGIFKRSPVAYTPLSWKRKPIFSRRGPDFYAWGGKRST
ncbi:hypothetical protein O3M35_006356 [Rhynocoris fuscipes]|uniref:Uncharacterized protein n=1 Tax=Rhynocoris fuscipes TaxID=488301 RepID=A0AAW1DGT0_9HEMI